MGGSGRQPGAPKTGGRTKGTRNKATAAKAAQIAASGETPLDFMLRVMRDQLQEFSIRLDAAKAAAPYVHPKLSTVEHMGKGGGPILHRRVLTPLRPVRAETASAG